MQKKLLMVLIFEVVFVAGVVVVTLMCFHTYESRSMVVGLICIVFNILMYASPLTVMVIKLSFLFYHCFYLKLLLFIYTSN